VAGPHSLPARETSEFPGGSSPHAAKDAASDFSVPMVAHAALSAKQNSKGTWDIRIDMLNSSITHEGMCDVLE